MSTANCWFGGWLRVDDDDEYNNKKDDEQMREILKLKYTIKTALRFDYKK